MKHTPGPWEVVDNHPTRAAIHIEPSIATLYTALEDEEKKDIYGKFQGDHVRMANARLITAAPKMFELLEKMVSSCEICEDGEIEYQLEGIEGFLPTGDANFVTESCPRCSEARIFLAELKGES